MAFEKTHWVWHNGAFLKWNEAQIHSSAFGLHYGSGVFEGIRCYETAEGPAIFRLKEHLDRLYASAAVYDLKIGYTPEELTEAIRETIRRNEFRNCYIRPTAFFDTGSLGIRAICPTSLNILTWEWPNDFGAEKVTKGMRVTVSPYRKFHSSMMPTTAKATGNYQNSILAVREAAARGFDEAILLDMHGNLAEGAVENIFLVKNGRLITNDPESSILLGITRQTAIDLARDLGCEVEIRTMTLEELLAADEAFLTGTAIEVTPIREVDGKPIGAGARGPVTERIQKAFFEAVSGRNPAYRHWLTPVSQAAGAMANV
ncbi:MAG: branched-chain amino acid transaminase [Blastocatellia bacterium]|nr:branched-chain amino acid transaminase [Blastocatellia bacterium]